VFLLDHDGIAVWPIDEDVVDFDHTMLGSFCEKRRVMALGELEGVVWRVG